MRQCIAEVARPTTPTPWGTVSQEFHCPFPLGSEIVYCRSCTAQCPRQSGSALHEFHCPLPPGSEALHCRSSTAQCPQAVKRCYARAHCPLPPGSEAVRSRSSTAHCPREAVRQCIAGIALPTTPRPWGTVSQEFHYPLPLGSETVYCSSCTAHCPRQWGSALHELHRPLRPGTVRQCIAGVALPTAPRQ